MQILSSLEGSIRLYVQKHHFPLPRNIPEVHVHDNISDFEKINIFKNA